MKKYLPLFSLLVLNLSIGSFLEIADASYPAPIDMYVNDFAEVLSPESYNDLRRKLEEFHDENRIHVVIVTVPAIEEYQAGSVTIEAFSKALFTRWQVGGEWNKLGIVVLLAVKDRNVRIELGGGYGDRYDRKMQEIIDFSMLPHLKEEQYAAGLHAGTLAVMESVKWYWIELYVVVGITVIALLTSFCLIFFWGRKNFKGGRSMTSEFDPSGSLGNSSGGGFSGGGSGGATGGW